jgi:hypothetical protein
VGGPPFLPSGDLVAVPSVVVAGQSFDLENSQCPWGTNAVFYEILPLGEAPDPTSPRNDGTHEGSIAAGSIFELVVVGTSPYLEPGNYKFVLDCYDHAPSEPAANVLRAMQTSLTISEPGRTVEISPAAGAPGATIEITPLGPCVGTEGGTVTVMFLSPQREVAAGQVNGSCEWGPSEVKVPSDLPSGEYSVEVMVTVDPNSPNIRYFIYQTTVFTIE